MNDRERLDVQKWVLERQLHWISGADTKAAALVALYLALGGIAIDSLKSSETGNILAIAIAISSIVSALGAGYAAAVFFPITTGGDGSMIFFGRIRNFKKEEYIEHCFQVGAKEIIEDIARQTHRNSEIAAWKYDLIRISMRLAVVAVACWVVTLASMAVA